MKEPLVHPHVYLVALGVVVFSAGVYISNAMFTGTYDLKLVLLFVVSIILVIILSLLDYPTKIGTEQETDNLQT